jgi:hypothetical protein
MKPKPGQRKPVETSAFTRTEKLLIGVMAAGMLLILLIKAVIS